jgi:hypothetical protein
MFKRYRKAAALGLFAVAVAGSVAIAAGMWPTLPVVGESSFCASTVTGVGLPANQGPYAIVPGSTQGTSIGICGQTVPAGPADLTGSELVPMDTGLGNGPPATVTAPIPSVASGAPNYVSALTLQGTLEVATATYAIPNNVTNTILDPTGTLTAATITLPASPLDGQLVRITSSQTITPTLVITATSAATTVKSAPTAFSSLPYSATFIYNLAKNTWYRL